MIKTSNTMESRRYHIILKRQKGEGFVARCIELTGCLSEVKTKKKALENIKYMVNRYLRSLKKHDEPIPPKAEEEMVEVGA